MYVARPIYPGETPSSIFRGNSYCVAERYLVNLGPRDCKDPPTVRLPEAMMFGGEWLS